MILHYSISVIWRLERTEFRKMLFFIMYLCYIYSRVYSLYSVYKKSIAFHIQIQINFHIQIQIQIDRSQLL